MNSRTVLLLCLATSSFLPAARAGIDVDITADIRLGRALPPPPPEVVVVERAGPPVPPPWARSHWYRRSHAYYYYPGCDVYYRPADHMWFYLEGGNWRLGARLPANIRVDFGRAVSLRLETDRPYLFHEKVVTYYPADYFARVRFKNDRDDRHEGRDHDDRDDHDRGKGHGRDKRRD